MKRLIFTLLALSVMATPSIAQKVTIDYAHDFDFSAVKTFAYVETKDTNAGSDLTDRRIADAIIRELKEGGAQQVDSNADLYITYHISTKDNTVFNTTTFGYGGWGPGWGGWGGYGYYGGGMGGSSTTTATTYTEGTLIIDAYEPAEKKMVWRGSGTVTLKSKPEKQYKQVDKILAKLGSRWDKILRNEGK